MKTLTLYSILYLLSCSFSGTLMSSNLSDKTIKLNKSVEKNTPKSNRNSVEIDSFGNLVYIDDIGVDDDISIVLEGTNYRLSNSAVTLTAGNRIKQDGNAVLIPITLVTGEIMINTKGGDDTFTVDLSKGNIRAIISYNGGEQNTSTGDDMVIFGTENDIYDTVTHTFINNSDGFVDITDNSRINYKGLEPIIDNLNVANRVFTFTGNNTNFTESMTIVNGGTLDIQIDSANYGETVDFNTPTNSLTINLSGFGDDFLDIRGIGTGFDGNLTVNGDEGDYIRFIAHMDIGSGNFYATGGQLYIKDVTTTGSITTTSENRTRIRGTIQTTNENISIIAGTSVVEASDNGGLDIYQGHIKTTGTGNITISGTGYATNNLNYTIGGFYMRKNSSISTNSGTINITGNGVNNGHANYRGMLIEGYSIIQSNSGNITLDGTGRNTANNENAGIYMTSGTIQTAGSGVINITGTGYRGMELTGTLNTTAGSGNIFLQGSSETVDSPAITLTAATQILSGDDIILSATQGPIITPSGIASQTPIDANNTTINGSLRPGESSPGQLIIDGSLIMSSNDTLEVQVNGSTTAGSDYDQLMVNGTIVLNGATLNLIDNSGSTSGHETIILIDGSQTNPPVGTFNGLPQGTSIAGNGKTWYIYYNLGSDVVLSTVPPTPNVVVSGGNLIFTGQEFDVDNLTIIREGSNYRISDSGKPLIAGSGATQDGYDVLVSIASVTGSININTGNGNDHLDVNMDGGNFVDVINFNGGHLNDEISVSGTSTFNNVTHTLTGDGEGSIAITGNSTITYVELEQNVIDTLDVNDRFFTLNVESFIDFTGSGVSDNHITVTGGTGLSYKNPNNSLTINGSVANQCIIQINGFATGFDADLTINGDNDDRVNFTTNTTNIGSGNLNVNSNTLSVLANIATTGSVTTITKNRININQATIQSDGGNISMTAGADNTSIGASIINMGNGHIQATGSGTIALNGTAFSNNSTNNILYGLHMRLGSSISTDTGTIDIIGSGFDNGNANFGGVRLENASTILSNGGDITIIGTGRNISNNSSIGVSLASGTIQTAGTGEIDITGTGYIGLELNGAVSATGSGNVSLQGTSGTIDALAINLSSSASQLQAGGNLNITANVGPINTPNGITSQTQFNANSTIINGLLAPGQSPGQLIVNGNLEMGSGDALEIEANGIIAGSDYDQVVVNGTVDLNGATLVLIDNVEITLNQDFVIIDNDGTDPINGTFNGLPNGAAITGNGKTWYIHYDQGDGNDVVLNTESSIPNVEVYSNTGTMVFMDPYQLNDNLTIIVEGSNYRISDSGKPVIAGAGTTQDGNDVLIPIASVTGDINISTGDGNDHLNVDMNGGNFADTNFVSLINFDGGPQTDGISFSGTYTYTSITHTFTNSGEGSVAITDNGVINYTALEQPIIDNLNVNERIFTLNVDSSITFDATGTLDNQILISEGSTLDYKNPLNSMTINGAGAGQGFIQINKFATGFNADLTINRLSDTIRFGIGLGIEPGIDLGSGDLNVASKVFLVRANFTTQGSITTTSLETTYIAEGDVTSSGGGNIMMIAGTMPASGTGGFDAIGIFESTIQTTGTGTISLNGAAYLENTLSAVKGIILFETNLLTDTGDITLLGSSALTGNSFNKGIDMSLSTVIQSNSGDITITGTGGNSIGASNNGVSMISGTIIKTMGSGTITINGNSGIGTNSNYGVETLGTTAITTENGNISITGTSMDTAGTDQTGVHLEGTISVTGTGAISLEGTSGTINAPAINLASSNTLVQVDGNITMTANLGPIHTPNVITTERQLASLNYFNECNIIINGILSPGQEQAIGQLTVRGNITLESSDTFEMEINDFTTPGSDYDHIKFDGSGVLNLNDATLIITDNSPSTTNPETITLINGWNRIIGTFNGLPQGAAIPGNGKTWYIYYNQGDFFDIILTTVELIPNVEVNGGNLVYTDPYQTNDDLTIIIEETNYRMSDSDKSLIAGSGAIQDGDDVLVPITSITGAININTGGGYDDLLVDLNGGNFTHAINFDGGTESGTIRDGMSISGPGIYTNVTHTFTGAYDGFVDISNNNTITYIGLEDGVKDGLEVNDRVFTLNVGGNVVLIDIGSLDNSLSVFQGSSVNYNNPLNSLTLDGTGGDDIATISIRRFDLSFDADLTVNRPNDIVQFGLVADTDTGSGNINLTAKEFIINGNVTTEGSITTTSLERTYIYDSTITSTAGKDIIMTSGTGLVPGIDLNRMEISTSTIQTTGIGNITLNGTGSLNVASSRGVLILETNLITDTGDVNITGTALAGDDDNFGVAISPLATIQSNGGDISIIGTGGNSSTGSSNIGVAIGAAIQTTGAGTITVNGISGTGENTNYGVALIDFNNSTSLTAENGNIYITGTSLDTTGTVDQTGVFVQGDVSINTTGNGDIYLTGTSGTTDAPAVNIVTSSTQILAGGNLGIIANLGPIHTPSGANVQTQFSAVNTTINGILAPGQSPGQLNINGNLIMASDDTLEMEVNDFTTAGTDYDQVVVNGIVTISGANLVLTDNSGVFSEDPETIILIDNNGTDPVVGTFNGLPNGTSIAGNGKTWYIYYNQGDGNDIILSSNIIKVLLSPKVFLQGAALSPNTGEETLMRDDLRLNNYIPLTSPYTDGLIVNASVFTATGTNAIVDWVWIELRDEANNTSIISSQSALLQRDGDVVGIDGISPLNFVAAVGNYFVVIKHRNHLGVMSENPITFNNTNVVVDFTNGSITTFGTNAQTSFGMPIGILGMWAGDANNDGLLNYLGAFSDVPFVRSQVFNDPNNSVFGGPPVASYSSQGYHNTDVNMNGVTVYSGGSSDVLSIRNNIFNNSLNSVFGGPPVATYTFIEQLPEEGN